MMDYFNELTQNQLKNFTEFIQNKLSNDLIAIKLYGSSITSKLPHDLDIAIIVNKPINDPFPNSIPGRTYCIPELHEKGVLIRRLPTGGSINIHYVIIPQKTWEKETPSETFARYKQSIIDGLDLKRLSKLRADL